MIALARVICLVLLALAVTLPQAPQAHAQGGTAWGLIDAVNALRIANGLPPYQVNNALMAAAQSHSDFQAANGVMTHTGKGGSNSRTRAAAFGYGGGAQVYVTENIAAGTSMTTQLAVNMWQGDAVHLNAMLSPSYTDVGAGVASDGNMTYFTLDVGYVAGAAGSPPAGSSSAPAGQPSAGNSPVIPLIMPVKVAEAQPDGAIVHEVEPGHTLIKISDAYKIELSDLLALNGLTFTSIIYPGQKILIRPPEPTPTATQQPLPTQTSSTPRSATQPPPTRTLAAAKIVPTDTLLTPSPDPARTSPTAIDPILIAIGALLVLGAALVVIGSLFRR